MSVNSVKTKQVDVLLLVAAAAWGSTYLAVKELAAGTPVLAVLSTRFLITTIALLLILLAKKDLKFNSQEVQIGTLLGFSQAAILYGEAVGVTKTSASNGGLIISLAIILTPILDGLWAKRWLPRSFFVATVVAFTGVALLVSSHGFRKPNVGDFIFLLCAFARAIHVTAIGHLTKGRVFSSLRLTFMNSLICALVYSLFGFKSLINSAPHFTIHAWVGYFYLGLFCTVFAFFAQTWAVRRTSPSRASLLLGTEPIWAVAIAVLIGGERLALLGIIGGALILLGTYLGSGIESRHRASS